MKRHYFKVPALTPQLHIWFDLAHDRDTINFPLLASVDFIHSFGKKDLLST